MTTGLRPETFQNLQLNAGAFFIGLDYSTCKTAAELAEVVKTAIEEGSKVLGATLGGGSFQCVPEARNIEADGMRYAFKGSTVFDSWQVKLTGTLKEVTPDNFARMLACADVQKDGEKTVLKVRTDLKDTDYIPHLQWVGDTSRGYVLIDLHNALNLAGANMTFADKNEGTLPFEFQAHQDDVTQLAHAPAQVVFFTAAEQEGA